MWSSLAMIAFCSLPNRSTNRRALPPAPRRQAGSQSGAALPSRATRPSGSGLGRPSSAADWHPHWSLVEAQRSLGHGRAQTRARTTRGSVRESVMPVLISKLSVSFGDRLKEAYLEGHLGARAQRGRISDLFQMAPLVNDLGQAGPSFPSRLRAQVSQRFHRG